MTGQPSQPLRDPMRVFDRTLVRAHRDRAAPGFSDHDFLVAEVADRLTDRLADINRTFSTVLDLGCHTGQLGRALQHRTDIKTLVQTDLSTGMLGTATGLRVAADEEALPFADQTFDLIASVLSLHWVNDLPGTLAQINRCLKPDGVFLGAFLGGNTLQELRAAFLEGELEIKGGAGSHISPFAEVRDAGGLLQRAGFALPVADVETLTVTYPNPFALMTELRGMGETNALADGQPAPLSRATLSATAAAYARSYGDTDGRVPATFDILYMTGWRPDPSQPQPLRPGSASTRLADALGSEEQSAGDKTPRG